MKTVGKLGLFGILVLGMTYPAFGFRRELIGTSGAQFLKLGVDARAIGMGEAYSAVTEGSEAIYWNPAGLGRIKNKSLSFMHAIYLKEVFYDFGSYAQKIGSLGAVGIGFQYLGTDSIEQTDDAGAAAGTFKPYDMAISLAWARAFKELDGGDFILGITGKFIQSKILKTASSGGADIGLSWEPLDDMWVSLVAQNMGAALKFKDEGDDLPLNIKVGTSYRIIDPWVVAIDGNFPRDNTAYVGVGTELKRSIGSEMWMAARAGYNSRTASDIKELSGISAGTGFGWGGYGLDFAWVPFGRLGNTYRVSFSAKF